MADAESVQVDAEVVAKPAEESVEPLIESESTETAQEPPVVSKELKDQIIQQIEYYFGDANLLRDKFLSKEVQKDDGWVSLDVMLTFKRLSALTTDPAVVCAALDESVDGLIEVSKDQTKIRRDPNRPLPDQSEETRKECITRTAYVKGFPTETMMADLILYFYKFDKVVNIVMRKYTEKPTKIFKFKGSIFVSFLTREQCEAFINDDSVEYNGIKLDKKWQSEYYASKRNEREALRQKKNEGKPAPKITFPTGAVVFFEGYSETVTRELIKEAVTKLGSEVAYIDYTKGDKSGYIRLTEENAAKGLLEKLEDSKLKINETEEATVRLVEGEEETEYLAKQVQQMISRPRRSNFHNRNKGGGNRFNRKRRGGSPDGSTEAKKKM